MSKELDQVALRAKRAARGVSTVDDLLRERIAELENQLDERLAAVQLCDLYYKIGCDALGQDEWDRRVREALTK